MRRGRPAPGLSGPAAADCRALDAVAIVLAPACATRSSKLADLSLRRAGWGRHPRRRLQLGARMVKTLRARLANVGRVAMGSTGTKQEGGTLLAAPIAVSVLGRSFLRGLFAFDGQRRNAKFDREPERGLQGSRAPHAPGRPGGVGHRRGLASFTITWSASWNLRSKSRSARPPPNPPGADSGVPSSLAVLRPVTR